MRQVFSRSDRGPVEWNILQSCVFNSEDTVASLLRVRREAPSTGVFEEGGAAIPIASQPDRERWLQKYLTLQWPVLE